MTIMKAVPSDLPAVKEITVKTIAEIYPHYYPKGAVDFFLEHHKEKNIKADIESGQVFLCLDSDENAVGTITIKENEICRFFVLPCLQGNGYGSAMLSFAEKNFFEHYHEITLSASLPAKCLYRKKGYVEVGSHVIEANYDDYLCYDEMIKKRST